jgi:Protein of unknown function (DUF4232)
MNAPTGRGRLVAVFLAGAALLMAGCSTSSASAGPTLSRTARASSSGLAAAPPSPSPTPIAALPTCKSGALSVLIKRAGAARGDTASYRIVFMDMADAPCKLDGFPGVSFYGRNSTQIGSAAVQNQSSPQQPVEVVPEGTVIAKFKVVNANRYSSACRQTTVRRIVVHPPGLTDSVRLPFSGLACANRKYHVLTVNAVVQGPPTQNED